MEDFQENSGAAPVQAHQERAALIHLVMDILETVVLAVLLFLVINAVTARVRVDGFSMEPNLQNGQRVLVNKWAYRFGQPQVGDVVVFHYPKDPTQQYIKRVIGLPGDQVVVANGVVLVNGVELEEPYLAEHAAYHDQVLIPENALYVLGDNRNNSSDSHSWGLLPMENLIGKALLVYWPLQNLGWISHTAPAATAP